MHETPIVASDCAFSNEILDRYEKVNFDPYDESLSGYNVEIYNIEEKLFNTESKIV